MQKLRPFLPFLFAAFFSLLFLKACQESAGTGADSGLTGEELSRIHCASCHLYPEPHLLDKTSWDKHVLPRMGYMMGYLPEDSVSRGYIEPAVKAAAFANPMLFREESPLTDADWKKLRDFYTGNAPEQAIRAEVRSKN